MVVCQLWSDVHTEFHVGKGSEYYTPAFEETLKKFIGDSAHHGAKYLFLAGDLGNNPKRVQGFLERLATGSWERIFWVPGNHEYYGRCGLTFEDAESKYRQLSLPEKVTNLHRRCIELPEMFVIGATLWTRSSHADFKRMNDGSKIRGLAGGHFSTGDLHRLHFEDRQWLLKSVEESKWRGKPLVIMTHHAPSFKLAPSNPGAGDAITGYYSNCEDIVKHADHWLFGHTHERKQWVLHDCHLHTNAHGYPGCHTDDNIYVFDVVQPDEDKQ